MGKLSSFLRPDIHNVREAEKATLNWFFGGFLGIISGIVFAIFLAPVGITLMILGAVVILGTIGWLSIASKSNSIIKTCPRCNKDIKIFKEETYFKCLNCGFFAVLKERK